ncbi:MAG: mechanosensitive ion channel domain-containing protein [Rubrivivax sp.]
MNPIDETRASALADFARLLANLTRPSALVELMATAVCLLAAFGLVRLVRGPHRAADSVWFGRRLYDGVLFPLFALGLALIARWLLREQMAIAVFALVVPILASLVAIRLVVRVLRHVFPLSGAMRFFERSLSWLVWMAVALWVTGLMQPLLAEVAAIQLPLGSTPLSLLALIQGAISVVVVMVLALSLSTLIETQLLDGAVDNLSVRKMTANALRVLLLFVGLMVALSAAGIDITTLGVLGGAIGVGIGLGLQKLASNYISGFVILAERSMRIGDNVKVDNFEGRITDIKTRYTVVRSISGREAIVPNEMLITQRVENLSLADPKVLVTTTVQVAYGTDLDLLMPQLVSAVASVPRVLPDISPAVQLSAFAPDGLELTVAFWIGDPHNGQGNVRSEVNLAVLRTLNAARVTIPFPQRVVRTIDRDDGAIDPSHRVDATSDPAAASAVGRSSGPERAPPSSTAGPTPAP